MISRTLGSEKVLHFRRDILPCKRCFHGDPYNARVRHHIEADQQAIPLHSLEHIPSQKGHNVQDAGPRTPPTIRLQNHPHRTTLPDTESIPPLGPGRERRIRPPQHIMAGPSPVSPTPSCMLTAPRSLQRQTSSSQPRTPCGSSSCGSPTSTPRA